MGAQIYIEWNITKILDRDWRLLVALAG